MLLKSPDGRNALDIASQLNPTYKELYFPANHSLNDEEISTVFLALNSLYCLTSLSLWVVLILQRGIGNVKGKDRKLALNSL